MAFGTIHSARLKLSSTRPVALLDMYHSVQIWRVTEGLFPGIEVKFVHLVS